MDFITVGYLSVALLLVLMGLGLNVGLSFILAGFISSSLLLHLNAAISLLGETSYSAIARPTWVAVPLFLLMGTFCAVGGLARRAYLGAYVLARPVPGALLITTCLSSGVFGAISGSSIATTTLFGKMALPEMMKFGYDRPLSVGCIAAAGTFASMIPPSIMLVIYALFTHQSVAELFAAGVIPGLLTMGAYVAAIIIRVKKNPRLAPTHHLDERFRGTSSAIQTVFGMWPIVLIAAVVLGGLYGGILTPTEAAAAGAVASLVIGVGLRSIEGPKELWNAIGESARMTATLFLLIVGALYFSRVMAISGLPQDLTRALVTPHHSPLLVLLAIMAIIFLLGMFIVPVGIYALTLPIIMPVLLELGYDPIWFGIIMLKLTEIAAITPPVGLNVFAMKAAAKDVSLGEIYRGCSVFLLVDIMVLVALVAFPSIALWLPSFV